MDRKWILLIVLLIHVGCGSNNPSTESSNALVESNATRASGVSNIASANIFLSNTESDPVKMTADQFNAFLNYSKVKISECKAFNVDKEDYFFADLKDPSSYDNYVVELGKYMSENKYSKAFKIDNKNLDEYSWQAVFWSRIPHNELKKAVLSYLLEDPEKKKDYTRLSKIWYRCNLKEKCILLNFITDKNRLSPLLQSIVDIWYTNKDNADNLTTTKADLLNYFVYAFNLTKTSKKVNYSAGDEFYHHFGDVEYFIVDEVQGAIGSYAKSKHWSKYEIFNMLGLYKIPIVVLLDENVTIASKILSKTDKKKESDFAFAAKRAREEALNLVPFVQGITEDDFNNYYKSFPQNKFASTAQALKTVMLKDLSQKL